MATAKKLPSGSWRCQVFSHFEEIKQPDGSIRKKKIYRSFTSSDPTLKGKKKAELEAAQFAAQAKHGAIYGITVNEAIKRYITAKKAVLSPSTITGYLSIQRTAFDDIGHIRLDKLTNEIIQKWISSLSSAGRSPKTVKNIYTLFQSAVLMFDKDLSFEPNLPAKQAPDLYTPRNEDIERLIRHVRGKDLEICIYLAAFGPMRRGEICALESDDIHGNTVTVRKSMVLTPEGKWTIKQPKTYAGYRDIEYPAEVIQLMSGRQGRIFGELTPNQLSGRFKRALKFAGLPHFRFHDLRHYSASLFHAMGVPDAYIMERGGWKTDNVMKRVYRHAMSEEAKQVTNQINDYFSQLKRESDKDE